MGDGCSTYSAIQSPIETNNSVQNNISRRVLGHDARQQGVKAQAPPGHYLLTLLRRLQAETDSGEVWAMVEQ